MAKRASSSTLPGGRKLLRDLQTLLAKKGDKQIKGDFEAARLLYLLNQNRRYREAGYARFNDLFADSKEPATHSFHLPFSSATGFRLVATYKRFVAEGGLTEKEWTGIGPAKLYNAHLADPKANAKDLARTASKMSVREMTGNKPLRISVLPGKEEGEVELVFGAEQNVQFRITATLAEKGALEIQGETRQRGQAQAARKLLRTLQNSGSEGLRKELSALTKKKK